MKKILIPVDLNGLDDVTLGYAKEFATKLDAQLYIITVLPYSDHIAHPQLAHYVGLEGPSYRHISQEILDKQVKVLEENGLKAAATAILQGDPASEIIDYADKEKVDFILIHTHGMGLIKRFTVGSVTNTLVHHANVPVFVIK